MAHNDYYLIAGLCFVKNNYFPFFSSRRLANNTLESSDLVTDNSITVSEGEQRKGAFSHYFYYLLTCLLVKASPMVQVGPLREHLLQVARALVQSARALLH